MGCKSAFVFGVALASSLAAAPVSPIHLRAYRTITAHSEAGRGVAFSPDSQLFATSSVDKTVRLRRLPETTLIRTLRHPARVTSVAFSADGQWLVSGSCDGMVRIWRVRDGAQTRTLRGRHGTTINVWRVSDGALQQSLAEHSDDLFRIAFSSGGKWLASSSDDKTMRLWQVSGSPLAR